MKRESSIEYIKNELIKSCVVYDTKAFIPFLLLQNVQTCITNKIRFYRFFKQIVNCTKRSSEGQLTFKIEHEKNTINQRNYFLNFYDKIHKHSRLSIEVREIKEGIYLDTLQF